MADIDIEIVTDIEGLLELEGALIIGGPKAAKKFLRQVEAKAAKVLQTSAKEYAPYRDGDLEEDINVQIITTPDVMTARVGPSQQTWYGLVQEIGATLQNGGTVQALHWLEDSARAVQSEVLQEYYQAVNDGIAEMTGGK